jgi:IS1 family transposase
VIHHLLEGSSIRATERLTGVHRDTICRLLVKFGTRCRDFLDREMHDLTLDHIEVDEVWTFVGKKQRQLTTIEKEESGVIGDMYLWSCVDAKTKLIPTFAVGKRSADMARRLMMDLAGRLRFPHPGAADSRNFQPGAFEPITQISTDGFAGYPEAVDLAFGPYVMYGQIIKDYRNADQPGRYAPPEMIGSQRRGIFAINEDEERTICTSHVERNNMTVRTFMKRFNRLTLGFSKKLENLIAAVSMFVAFYNYCWRTRLPGKSGRYRVTAAMAAGLVGNVWSVEDLFRAVA